MIGDNPDICVVAVTGLESDDDSEELDADIVTVYVVEALRPVNVYGDPLENVAVTVEPGTDGTAVIVLDVIPLSFVKVTVKEVVVVFVIFTSVGIPGNCIAALIKSSVDFSSRSNSATILLF